MQRNRQDDVVGLDIGAGELKVAVVRDDQAIRIGHARLPEGLVVDGLVADPDALAAELRRLWRKMGLRSRRVSFSIANRRVQFRRQSLPRSANPDDLHLAITTGAEMWFAPMRLDQVIIDYAEQDAASTGRLDLELCAADKAVVLSYMRVLRKARLVPMACQYGPLIESKALAFPRDLGSSHLLVNIGAEKTSFTAVNGSDVLFSRLIDMGGNDFTHAIAERLSLPFEAAEKLKRTYGLDGTGEADEDLPLVEVAQEALLGPTDRLVQALADMRSYYEKQPEGRPAGAVTLLGGGARLSGLKEQIVLYLGIEEAAPSPRGYFDVVPDIDLYAGAIGLAWKRPMSLLPPAVGTKDKGPLRPKVDRRRAQKLSKNLRRKQAAANPVLVWAALGLVGFMGSFMYGNRLKSAEPEIVATEATRNLAFSDADVTLDRVAQLLNRSAPVEVLPTVQTALEAAGARDVRLAVEGQQLNVAGVVDDPAKSTQLLAALRAQPGIAVGTLPATAPSAGGTAFAYSLGRTGA